MSPKPQHYDFANQLLASKDFFDRSTRVLDEADSGFRPQADMMTVAQQVAHTAQTIDWFIEGASRPEGFDLDFEKHAKALEQCNLARRRPPGTRIGLRKRDPFSAFEQPRRISRGRSRPAR